MSTFIIPVSESTDPFEHQVELDGRIYDMTFRWSERGQHWSLDLGRNGNILIGGVKLTIIPDLMVQYRRIGDLPDGTLFIDDLDGEDNEPSATNFGDRVVLKYTEAP